MRSDSPATGGSVLVRLRAQLPRVRRAFLAQPPLVRWVSGLAAVVGLLALAYGVAPSAATGVPLRSGRRFSLDELSKITRALEAKHVPFRVDEANGRVEVDADRETEALDLLQTLDIGPRPLADIQKSAKSTSLLDTLAESRDRQLQGRNEVLAEMIRRFPDSGIVSALVEVQRRSVRGGLRPSTTATAFVYLQTEDDRPLGDQTLQKIQNLLVAYEPDVKREAVTVFDQTGRHYLDASNPSVGQRSLTRAREEDLAAKILKELDHIKGVKVTVQLPGPSPAVRVAAPVPPPPPPPADEVAPPLAANQPVALEAMPEPEPEPPAPRAEPSPAAPPLAPEPARVWVKVPSSFYLRIKPSREPSSDELRQLAEKTEAQVRTAVELVIPRAEFSEPKVTVDTIVDHLEVPSSPVPAVAPEAHRWPTWWVAVGLGVGLAVALVGAAGIGLAAARRPLRRRSSAAGPAPDFHRFHAVDAAEESGSGADRPGPSERVRELIRLNPEAAAGVLQRWTGPGGTRP